MLNDDPPGMPGDTDSGVSQHSDLAWLADTLMGAGMIRGREDLLRGGSRPDAKTFYLTHRPAAGPSGTEAGQGIVVRFHGGAHATAPEWPGEAAFFESLPRVDLPVQGETVVFRDRVAARACTVTPDLRATHFRAWDSAGDIDAARTALIASVARVHGVWWPSRDLRQKAGTAPFGLEALMQRDRRIVARAAAAVARMSHIRADVLNWMEATLDAAATSKQARLSAGSPLTRVHGSPSLGALWLPRKTGSVPVILTDWDDWRIDLWAGDIARLLLDDTSGRLSLEKVLSVYSDTLAELNIDNHSRAEMLQDIRACMPFEMAVAIVQGRATASRTAHWRMLIDHFV